MQEVLTSLTADRTLIVVAHRLQTIASADQILVLDDGGIAEGGTFDEILFKRARSANTLWRSTRELFAHFFAETTSGQSRFVFLRQDGMFVRCSYVGLGSRNSSCCDRPRYRRQTWSFAHGQRVRAGSCTRANPPSRGNRRSPSHWIRCDDTRQAEDELHHVGRDDVGRGTLGDDLSILHRDEVGRVASRVVEIVQHRNKRVSGLVQIGEQF